MLLTITTTGKVTLLLVAGTFIAWAFVTAILIPRRRPDFPRSVGSFVAVTAVLFAAQMGAVYWVTATQEVEREAAAEPGGGETTAPAETTPGETAPTGTAPTGTAPTGTAPTGTAPTGTAPTDTAPTDTPTETAPAASGGEATAGKAVFMSAGCTSCHTLGDAGSNGTVGPNLDDAKPPFDLVVTRVTEGKGSMPPFKGQLSEQQIKDVAAYVSSVAGS